MNRSYNYESLEKHNVSIDEINEVLQSRLTLDIDLDDSERGNNRVMWVGFTFNLRLLEIGIEYFPEDREHVFHANEATKPFKEEFEQQRT